MICAFVLALGVLGAGPSLDEAIGTRILPATLSQEELATLFGKHQRPGPERFKDADAWRAEATWLRQQLRDRIFMQGAVKEWAQTPARIEESGEPLVGQFHRVRRFRLEVIPGTWTSMWLHEPLLEPKGKVPVVLSFIGHGSGGDATDAIHQARAIHLARQGLYVVTVEWFGNGETEEQPWSHMGLNHIDLWGTHGVGLMVLLLERGVDFALSLPHVDPARVASTGLSGGGWQALMVAALDERVTLAAPVAGFTGFATSSKVMTDLGDSEQAAPHLQQTADYTEIASLIAPRPLLLTYNEPDSCCFRASRVVPLMKDTVGAVYALLGASDQLRFHVNTKPGTHNYEADNRAAFYRMLVDHGFVGEGSFSLVEDDLELDVRTPEEFLVGLPPNRSLAGVAAALGEKVKRQPLPSAESFASWRTERQAALARLIDHRAAPVVKWPEERAVRIGQRRVTTLHAQIDELSVPVVVVEPAGKDPKRTVIVLHDESRTAAASQLSDIGDDARVVFFDLLHMGDRKHRYAEPHYSMLLSSVGRSSLGIQTTEVRAFAQRFAQNGPVEIVAVGRRTTFIALVASALIDDIARIDGDSLLSDFLTLSNKPKRARTIYKQPETFVFGLAEQNSIDELIAMCAHKHVTLRITEGRLPEGTALEALSTSLGGSMTLR